MAVNSNRAVQAFNNFEERKFNHDTTTTDGNGNIQYRYRGNVIATKTKDGRLFITDAGWQTVTTKDRLNNLLPNGIGVSQKDYIWYIKTYNVDKGYKEQSSEPMKVGAWYEVIDNKPKLHKFGSPIEEINILDT